MINRLGCIKYTDRTILYVERLSHRERSLIDSLKGIDYLLYIYRRSEYESNTINGVRLFVLTVNNKRKKLPTYWSSFICYFRVLSDFPHSLHRPVVISSVGMQMPLVNLIAQIPRWNFKKKRIYTIRN